MNRTYTVYSGSRNGQVFYIGTTIQEPSARFRWHKANGKKLDFKVLFQFDNQQDMLDKEYELIQKHKPRLNKITHRRQNLNAVLSQDVLDSRKGDSEWCQSCLKRRVNKGYKHCYWCN
jgi:hypothetical protein